MVVPGGQVMTVQQLRASEEFTFLLPLPVTTSIYPAGVVVGCSNKRELINVGNYVQFSATPSEVCTWFNIHICLLIFDSMFLYLLLRADQHWDLGCLL